LAQAQPENKPPPRPPRAVWQASSLELAGPARPQRRVRTTATACERRWCSRFSGYERALGGTDQHRSCFNAVASPSEWIRRAKNPCLLLTTSLSSHTAGWRCGDSSTSCRSHVCHEEPSRATSLEKCSSLRILWVDPLVTLFTSFLVRITPTNYSGSISK
jgi:hypothetical protein